MLCNKVRATESRWYLQVHEKNRINEWTLFTEDWTAVGPRWANQWGQPRGLTSLLEHAHFWSPFYFCQHKTANETENTELSWEEIDLLKLSARVGGFTFKTNQTQFNVSISFGMERIQEDSVTTINSNTLLQFKLYLLVLFSIIELKLQKKAKWNQYKYVWTHCSPSVLYLNIVLE